MARNARGTGPGLVGGRRRGADRLAGPARPPDRVDEPDRRGAEDADRPEAALGLVAVVRLAMLVRLDVRPRYSR